MKIWCVYTVIPTGGEFSHHRCAYWFRTRKEAAEWLGQLRRKYPKARADDPFPGGKVGLLDSGIDLVDVPSTKAEMIQWLNKWHMFIEPEEWPDPIASPGDRQRATDD